jgi:CBS domain-containing protein
MLRTSDVMTSEVLTVRPEMTLMGLEAMLRTNHISGAPVTENGKLVGIISLTDIGRQLRVERSYAEALYDLADEAIAGKTTSNRRMEDISSQLAEKMEKLLVRDAMIQAVVTARPDQTIVETAQLFLDHRVHHLLVTDDAGNLVGIVSNTDFVRLIAKGEFVTG